MSRYIDADALYEYITNQVGGVDCSILFDEEIAPSIDIVRCGECIKHNTHRCHMAFDLVATEDDDFCSYGVKKGTDGEGQISTRTCRAVEDTCADRTN